MSWKQTRNFVQSRGGTRTGWCLQNVRLGYGINSRYPNAWAAWGGTQQHRNRSIPSGVAVPLFYDWVSGGTRFGHINVRLPDGRVWNDGRVFQSLATFERSMPTARYVGWGESVNNVRVIEQVSSQGGNNVANTTRSDLDVWYRFWLGRAVDNGALVHVGKARTTVQNAIKNSAEYKQVQTRAAQTGFNPVNHLPSALRSRYNHPNVSALNTQITSLRNENTKLKSDLSKANKEISSLKKVAEGNKTQLETKRKEIDALRKQLKTAQSVSGDLNKWETFKSLIRELFNFGGN
jgi:hypothetical protein